MKRITSLLSIAVVLMIIVSSCSKQPEHINTIPGDAFAVMTLKPDPENRDEMVKEIKANEDYQEMMEKLREDSEVMADLLEDFIEDPTTSGIDMYKESFFFAAPMDDNMIYGTSMLLKKASTFEETLKKVAKEMEFELKIEDEDGFKKVSFPKGIAIWDKTKVMIIGSDGMADLEENAKELMNQKAGESIMEDKDFAEFYNNVMDFNMWFSSNIENMDTEITMMEKMLDVQLDDNYAHMHFDWDKKAGQFTMIAKMRVNEDIRDMSINEMAELMEETDMLDRLPMFGGPGAYADEWAEEELSEDEWEKAQEAMDTISEEDVEAMLKELEAEMDEDLSAE
jgi:hypothetical protein